MRMHAVTTVADLDSAGRAEGTDRWGRPPRDEPNSRQEGAMLFASLMRSRGKCKVSERACTGPGSRGLQRPPPEGCHRDFAGANGIAVGFAARSTRLDPSPKLSRPARNGPASSVASLNSPFAQAATMSQNAGWGVMVSHRSGETEDRWLSKNLFV